MAADKGSLAKKMAVRMAAGAVVGAVVTYALLSTLNVNGFTLDDPARLAAAAVGLCYALMGLSVGVGTLAPRAGAAVLNVEDADEIVEQKPLLIYSAISCILIGVLLIGLALLPAGPAYAVPVAATSIAMIVLFVLLSMASSRHSDEMTKQVSRESSALAMHISFVLFGAWAILAHLGKAPWIEPIGFISGMCAVYLAAVFVAAGRRGMLNPR